MVIKNFTHFERYQINSVLNNLIKPDLHPRLVNVPPKPP